ncbi:tensin-3 isoform X1 [Megalobrama amblycephala]|uniref:tensin-3 isoform X1 n=1 Tax=Megalobrama amblycephala TaxID=75352 RepID=UPI0020146CA7|nr:tensin-3 isoform X1 [Megalobrama amblycephala]XP_048064591.1 tensin-3 isoform X1 [Megalobrama amblycephala]
MAEESEFDLNYITERIISVTFHQSCTEQMYQHNLRRITQMLQSKHADQYMVLNLSEHSDDLSRMNHRVVDLGWPESHAPSLHLLCSLCKNMNNWLSAHPENVLLLHCKGSKDRVGVVISSYIQLSNVFSSEEHALDLYSMKKFCSDKMVNLMTPSQKRYVQVFGRLLTHQIHINPSLLSIHRINIQPIPDFHPTVCQLFIRVYQGTQTVYTSGVHQVAVGQTDSVCFVLEPPQMIKGDVMIACYHKNVPVRTHETVFRVQFHTGALSGDQLSLQKEDLDHANKDPRFPEDGEVEVIFSEIAERDPFLASDCGSRRNSSAVVIEKDSLDSLQDQWDFSENLTAAAKPNEGTHSLSSDSGLSSSSQWTGGQASGLTISYSSEEHTQLHRVTPGPRMEEEQPSLDIPRHDPIAGQAAFDHSRHLNGEALFIERETDIIDDDDDITTPNAAVSDSKDTLSSKELSDLSSGECQTSIQSDYCQSNAPPATFRDDVSSSNTLIHSIVPAGYQTHIWVKQQQSVSQSTSNTHTPSDKHKKEMELHRGASKPSLPDNGFPEAQSEPDKDDEFATLALDVDQSIEQLNQLILDLDPDFEPIPTQARSHMTRSASLHTNGKTHSGEKAKSHQSGWRQKQLSDVSEYSVLRSTGGDRTQNIQRFGFDTQSLRGLHHTDTVDFGDLPPEIDSPLWVGLNQVPPTPAFPVTPPTPYGKIAHDFTPSRPGSQTNRHYMSSPIWQESRGYVDSMTHTSMSSDGELFHSDVTGSSASCQRMFGSMHSMSTPSPLVNTDSPTPAHSWLEGGSSTPLSHYTPQSSPPLTLSAPNSHSSPRGAPRSLTSSLDVGGLESSLLEAVEGLEALGLDVAQPPLLPLKRRGTEGSETMLSFPLSRSATSTSYASHNTSPTRSTPSPDFMASKPENVKFVQDTSKFWYKPDISREQAIGILKDKEPGSFIIRDSHSFRGAYGLAMKVATPPPSVLQQSRKMGDLTNELVRHFLIECTPKGVRLKGCPNEPYFGSLTALVCQHSITPLALPCRLIIPGRDPLEESNESPAQTSTNSAAELLKQGAACNVWFLGSVELESLTGVQGVQKATTVIFSMDPPTTSTVVHFKVSAQGITLTDNQRKLFFRRHYAVNTVIFCALDPQDRKWTRDGCTAAKIFGFIARKSGSSTENVCHLFAEHDPEQPASAIVNFVSKVMIGSQKTK